jgi:predicted DsbA family dithiol-disulfide isomerase
MSQYVYATQPQWQDRIGQMSDADKAALEKMPIQQQVIRFAQLGGMAQMAARFGVSPSRARQCLTDPKALQHLLDMTQAANDKGVSHTPTFVVNGKMTDAATWEELEPEIKAALGNRG